MELNEFVFRKLLGLVLVVAFVRLLVPARPSTLSPSPCLWRLLIAGALMGLASGLIGVGGGFSDATGNFSALGKPQRGGRAFGTVYLGEFDRRFARFAAKFQSLHPDMGWLIAAVVVGADWGVLGSVRARDP